MALSTMIGVATRAARNCLQISVPLMPRQAQIHQHQVGLQGNGHLEALAAVAGLDRAKAFLFQHHPDRVAQAFIVVDHENRLHCGHT